MVSTRAHWMVLAFALGLLLVAPPHMLCSQDIHSIFDQEDENPAEQDSEPKKKQPDKKLPSARTIINKYVQALGGYELLESRKTIHYKANATKANDPFDYEVHISNNCYRSTYNYRNGREFIRTINNGVAWTTTNGSHRLIDGEELNELLSRHKTMCPVTKWLDDHQKIEVVGREKINDRNTIKVLFVNEEGYEKHRFFDEETGLVIRTIAEETYGSDRRHVIRDYFDYEMVGDALVPKTKHLKSKTLGTSSVRNYTFEIEEYEVDIKIPKGTFDIPKTIRTQVNQNR